VTIAPAAGVQAERGFPLVPRRPLHGLELGPFRGVRRGVGSDPAGSRPYRPGDDVRAIDWGASARLSAARGTVEFVVRERFAEQAPRVVLASDRRPGMALHAAPWLSKPDVLVCSERLIAESAFRARGLVGSLHFVGDEVVWTRPTGNPRAWRSRPTEAVFTATRGSLADGIEQLGHARALPPGSFLFVLSDFLDPVPEAVWLAAITRGWDVVPVVVQDPTWEASFPAAVGGLVLPIADPVDGRVELVRLSADQARERRDRHAARLAGIVGVFAELGLDAIVLHSGEQDAILTAFVDWAAARLLPEGRL
jgi:uncharacterized protein (DUF58 family)